MPGKRTATKRARRRFAPMPRASGASSYRANPLSRSGSTASRMRAERKRRGPGSAAALQQLVARAHRGARPQAGAAATRGRPAATGRAADQAQRMAGFVDRIALSEGPARLPRTLPRRWAAAGQRRRRLVAMCKASARLAAALRTRTTPDNLQNPTPLNVQNDSSAPPSTSPASGLCRPLLRSPV